MSAQTPLRLVKRAVRPTGVTVRLTFPGRRYHATPWGHHVNEGLIEWPPSPWRVLRALIATGYAKLHWSSEGPPADAVSLIEKLSSVLPTYRLPHVIGTHSRHYMPLARFKNGREDTTLVLDTWAQVDGGWLGINWDVDLNEAEESLLGRLVRDLGYLGRSESWVEAALAGDEMLLDEFFVTPGGPRPGPDWQQVALLAPEGPGEYASWRQRTLDVERAKLPTTNSKGKALSKKQTAAELARLESAYPPDLVSCLQVHTPFLQEFGWSQPPGTRKVFYWRPTDALAASPTRIRSKLPSNPAATFALLALATESSNRDELPSVTRTLPQGELLHRAIVSKYPKGDAPEVFSGCDPAGEPLRKAKSHQHLHVLHLDLDDDKRLDHVFLWAPMGMDGNAQSTLRRVRRGFAKNMRAPLLLAVVGMGELNDALRVPAGAQDEMAQRLRRVVGGERGSREWISVTPFVPPRFLKKSGKNSLEGQIRAELSSRGMAKPLAIEVLHPTQGSSEDCELARTGRHFIRRRSHGAEPPPIDCGFMVRLTFDTEVRGPLLLGYGCHFGSGAFVASDPRE